MKKVIISILLLCIIIVISFTTWYNHNLQELNDIKKFNKDFEEYLDKSISGVDLTTIINKAIENNNQYQIVKNDDGTYKDDKKNSIIIFIQPLESGKYYPMEAYEKVGMKEFTKNFGSVLFKSKKVEYHKNGRISKILFGFESSID